MAIHHGVRVPCCSLVISPKYSRFACCQSMKYFTNKSITVRLYGTKQEKREKLFEEIKKGYFHDVTDYQKHGGKRSLANQELLTSSNAATFPDLEVRSLSGRTNNLSKERNGKVTLLVACLRATGATMFPLYRQPFLEAFGSNDQICYRQLNIVNQPIIRYFGSSIIRSLKKQTPVNQHDYFLCHFGAAQDIKRHLFGNILVAHAFLLDTTGKVRWKCHAKPTNEEIELLLKFTRELINQSK